MDLLHIYLLYFLLFIKVILTLILIFLSTHTGKALSKDNITHQFLYLFVMLSIHSHKTEGLLHFSNCYHFVIKEHKNPLTWVVYILGTRGRTRTVMISLSVDFESTASTNFATRASGIIVNHNTQFINSN